MNDFLPQRRSSLRELLSPKVTVAQIKREIRQWSYLSFLTGVGNFSEMTPWLVSLIMIGHVSTQQLAALGLVEVWLYSFLEVLWTGLGLTESVLVSQAHGKKNLLAMRGWAIISVIIMTAGNGLVAVLCVTASPTLKSFGLDPTLVDIGQVYATYIIPAIFIEGVNICLATYLCSLQAPVIPTLIHLFGVLVDIPVSYFFIFGRGSDDSKFIRNALVGSALGWIASAGVVMILNTMAVAHLWGRELTYGDQEDEEEEGAGGKVVVLRGDDKKGSEKRFYAKTLTLNDADDDPQQQQQQAQSRGPSTSDAGFYRKVSMGGGGFGVGFRKNSGLSSVVLNSVTSAVPAASSVAADGGAAGGGALTRAMSAPANSGSMYARLLSATSLLPNDAGDGDDEAREDEGEDGAGADASIPSALSWLANRRRWRVYSSQAIPNCLTVLVQCSVFTVLSFLAANLGAVEIAAHNQNIALLEVAFTFVGGMAEGTSIRVGYHIGKGNVEAAKLVAQIAFSVNTVLGLCVGLIGYFFRRELASCLSSDPAVVDVSVQLAPLLWSTFALFSIGDQALGVLEGQGRATAQAVAFLVGAVGVTIPLALISYFCTDYGLLGLWYALLIGFLLSELIAIVLVVHYSNWHQYTREATARVDDADGPDEDAWTPLQSKQDAELLDKITQIRRTTSRDREAERLAGVAFLSGSD